MSEDREFGMERAKRFGIHGEHDTVGVEGFLSFGFVLPVPPFGFVLLFLLFGFVLLFQGYRDRKSCLFACLFYGERLPFRQEDTSSFQEIVRHSLDEGG